MLFNILQLGFRYKSLYNTFYTTILSLHLKTIATWRLQQSGKQSKYRSLFETKQSALSSRQLTTTVTLCYSAVFLDRSLFLVFIGPLLHF